MNNPASPPVERRGRNVPAWSWSLIGLRLAALLLALTVCCALYYLCAAFVSRNPVPRRFLGTAALISGVRVRTSGTPAAAHTFFLANHVSWLDILALAGQTGTAFVAHDGLAAIGPLRWLCELNDTVFIARHDRNSIAAQVKQVRAAMNETGGLTIFPEGTTSDGTGLLPFKSSLLSALEADADHFPVQPVALDYGPQAASIAWVGSETGLDNALRILARWRPVDLTITFLPALSAAERANRKTMARAASETIAASLKHP